jgi:hypothetical protein
MIGYKAFNHNWTCRGYQYEVDKTCKMDPEEIKIFHSGFHFYKVPIHLLEYYKNDSDKYAEIKAFDNVIEQETICVSNKIKIIRELTTRELYELTHGLFIFPNDPFEHYEKGKLHRTDGPAVEKVDGRQLWYENRMLHRIYGPSLIWPNGVNGWYQYRKLHREDGPATVLANGSKEWYLNGNLHRLNGPAVDGKLHRLDGPVLIWPNEIRCWSQNGNLSHFDFLLPSYLN